jgi:hypothetical protein
MCLTNKGGKHNPGRSAHDCWVTQCQENPKMCGDCGYVVPLPLCFSWINALEGRVSIWVSNLVRLVRRWGRALSIDRLDGRVRVHR